MSSDPMALADEIERLCDEYRTGTGSEREEAWNLIADCVEENSATVLAALRACPAESAGSMRERCLALCASWENPPAAIREAIRPAIRPEYMAAAQATARGLAAAIRALPDQPAGGGDA